jgi:predicted dehydrogenase
VEIEIPWNAPNDRPCRIFIGDATRAVAKVEEFPIVDQYTIQGDEFSRAIRGEREIPVPLEDAIANMAVIEAIFKAAESGKWERLEKT